MHNNSTLIIRRNLIILKNYLLQNKTLFMRNVSILLIISYTFKDMFFHSDNTSNHTMDSLFAYFLIFLFSVKKNPLRFHQKADLIKLPNIRDVLKQMIWHNVFFVPLVMATVIEIPACFFYKNNKLFFFFTIHALLVGWFAGNIIANFYKIKNIIAINKKLTFFIVSLYLTITTFSTYILDKDLSSELLDIPMLKFIPLLGWLLELLSGNTANIYLMYFGFLFTICAYLFYLYKNIVTKAKSSSIREHLLNMIEERQRSKVSRNVFAVWAEKFKLQKREIKTDGKFASALHYRNLCLNKRTKLYGYFDLRTLITLMIIIPQALIFDSLTSEKLRFFSSNTNLLLGNIMLCIYLLARKEKSAQPDFYFAMIPDRSQNKINQLIRHDLIKVTIPVFFANLLLVPLIGSKWFIAILISLITPALYLFKYANSFIFRIYVKTSSHSGYYTLLQGALNIICGLIIPERIIALLSSGLNLVALLGDFFQIYNRNQMHMISILIQSALFLFYHLSVYGVFYAFFDKIYRKIDFGKN